MSEYERQHSLAIETLALGELNQNKILPPVDELLRQELVKISQSPKAWSDAVADMKQAIKTDDPTLKKAVEAMNADPLADVRSNTDAKGNPVSIDFLSTKGNALHCDAAANWNCKIVDEKQI